MRIIAVRDIVTPIRSQIANASIDFSAMTASVLAIITDEIVDGRPVVGFGFNSNGRAVHQDCRNVTLAKRIQDARAGSCPA
jgi:hypothetical protein